MSKIITIVIVIFLSTILFAEKTINFDSVNNSIIIDGIIEESEWANAKVAEDFVEINPGIKNLPAIASTNVRVAYDKKNLYVAFKAFDDPELIRVNQSKRDDIADDDRLIVSLDPRNDGVVEHYLSCLLYTSPSPRD